jgi:hypothetical protein
MVLSFDYILDVVVAEGVITPTARNGSLGRGMIAGKGSNKELKLATKRG